MVGVSVRPRGLEGPCTRGPRGSRVLYVHSLCGSCQRFPSPLTGCVSGGEGGGGRGLMRHQGQQPAWGTYFFICPYEQEQLWNVKKYVSQVGRNYSAASDPSSEYFKRLSDSGMRGDSVEDVCPRCSEWIYFTYICRVWMHHCSALTWPS